jgi:transposase
VGIELNPGPRNGEHLEDEQKWEIVIEGKKKHPNYSKIARKVKTTPKTVKAVLQKYKETGSIKDRPRSGRKRKFTEAEAKKMVKQAKKGKFATQIARESPKKPHVNTVRNYLNEGGIKWLKKKKIQRLSERHKIRRVEYSHEMKGYNWNKVLFSDEKTFYLGASSDYAWQDPKNRISEEKTPYPKKLNVWGAIGTHMKAKLYYFETNLNSELYVRILKTRLKEKQLIYAPKCPKTLAKKWEFLQDNAKYHKTTEAMETIEDLVGDRNIEHPANSPDLNPMENMWSYLDSKVKEAGPKTISSLKRVLTRAWNDLSWEYVAKSTKSMSRRLQKCIECGGQRLDY